MNKKIKTDSVDHLIDALLCLKTKEESYNFLEDLITELIIGPESTQSTSILQDYLQDHGLTKLAAREYLSNCPLRRPLV